MSILSINDIAYLLNCPQPISFVSSAVVQNYCIDSRKVKPGDLFIALKGERVDGHQFLEEAEQKGAIAAVISSPMKNQLKMPLLFVEDSVKALQELAQHKLALSNARVIGITGSVGKTSTKELTYSLLSTTYQVCFSEGNQNSQLGLPLTILNNLKEKDEVIILEMGMSAAGHLARLVQIAPPEVAVLTNVSLVHAENFSSLYAILQAKEEIFSQAHTKAAILSMELPFFERVFERRTIPTITFSTKMHADYRCISTHPLVIKAYREDRSIMMGKLPIPGAHNIHNLLAAIAVARYFQVPWKKIKSTVPYLRLPKNRLEFITHKEIVFLNDSYNASEASVKAALQTMPKPKKGGRKIAVLASMMELGSFSSKCHEQIGIFALDYVQIMYCLGKECEPIYTIWRIHNRQAFLFESHSEFFAQLRKDLHPNDVVLLKGSHSKELWKVIEEL